MIIYNLFPTLCGPMGGWPQHAERAAAMGFSWLFLNPIHQTGRSKSLYSVADYFTINPELVEKESPLGPDDQMRRFIATAEGHGLRVMADLVLNHCAVDSALVQRYPAWFHREPGGQIMHPRCNANGESVIWGDLARLDHRPSCAHHDKLYAFFVGVCEYLLQLGFRGFRCDVAYQVHPAFWRRLLSEIRRRDPPVVFVAETLGCEPALAWQTAAAGFDYVMNSAKWWDYRSPWLLQQQQILSSKAATIAFAEDHDTARLFDEVRGNVQAVKQRFLFTSLFSAGSLTPIGFEYGFCKRLNVKHTRAEHWEEPRVDLQSFIATVNALKKRYAIFNEDGPTCLLPHRGGDVLVLWKGSLTTRQEVLLILNRNVEHYQHVCIDDLDGCIQSSTPLRDVSPEYPLEQIPEHYFAYDLRPGQCIVLLSCPEEEKVPQIAGEDASAAAGDDEKGYAAQCDSAEALPSLCVLPWRHLYVGTTGFAQRCCVSGTGEASPPVLGSVREQSLEQLFHSDAMARTRKQMLAGVWPRECRHCELKEARGVKSSRQNHNEIHAGLYQRLVTDSMSVVPELKGIDLRYDNVCNFKCRTCSGFASSAWYTDHNALYPENPIAQPVIGIADADAFWSEFFDRLVPKLDHLHLAGGEPLVSKTHYRLLELLIACGNTELELYYDTNLSRLRFQHWDLVELWKAFGNLTICLSLDGVGAQGEFIRSGLDYASWRQAVERLKTELPHAKRKMHFVVSIYNVVDLGTHLQEIMEAEIVRCDRLRLTFLEWPPYLNPQALPHHLKKRCEQGLRQVLKEQADLFGEPLRKQIEALLSFIRERDLYEQHRGDFVAKTRFLDQRRGEDMLALFPHLKAMFSASDKQLLV